LFELLIDFSLRSRSFIVLLLLGLAASGVYSLLKLPIDAVPDVTNVQVMVLTDAPALGPEEVEQFVTIPVENSMNGIPFIEEVRSITQFGLSAVTIVFEEGTDIYWARQQVNERVINVRDDIVGSLGNAWFAFLPGGDLMTSWLNAAAGVRVEDADELRDAVEKLVDVAKGEFSRGGRRAPAIVETKSPANRINSTCSALNGSRESW